MLRNISYCFGDLKLPSESFDHSANEIKILNQAMTGGFFFTIINTIGYLWNSRRQKKVNYFLKCCLLKILENTLLHLILNFKFTKIKIFNWLIRNSIIENKMILFMTGLWQQLWPNPCCWKWTVLQAFQLQIKAVVCFSFVLQFFFYLHIYIYSKKSIQNF